MQASDAETTQRRVSQAAGTVDLATARARRDAELQGRVGSEKAALAASKTPEDQAALKLMDALEDRAALQLGFRMQACAASAQAFLANGGLQCVYACVRGPPLLRLSNPVSLDPLPRQPFARVCSILIY